MYLSHTGFSQNKIKMIANLYNTIDFDENKWKYFMFLLIHRYISF